MIKRSLVVFVLLICVSCKPARQQQAGKPAAAAGPQQQATVIAIRTTLEPGNRVHNHELLVAGDKARATFEQDSWRLYDTKANSVTFVDDVTKSYRTESLVALVARRRAALAASIPEYIPRATLARTNETKALHGANAQQSVVKAGAYERELWLAEHPAIPPRLFTMMELSDTPNPTFAPMMRAVDEALATTDGFALVDRAELPFGKGKFVVDKSVVSITRRAVPQSLFEIPRDYEDRTPKPAPPATTPGANRRRAS